ncbi:MAG TPA: hypothetical protein VE398_16385 [Acidobacteriota bacterium]|nr:hypothetical protein [Acidobacteriota bacterium]
MNSAKPDIKIWQVRGDEGKGIAGCLFFLVLLGLTIIVGVLIGPHYYAFYGFETDVKAEVSRAGANFLDDETVAKDIMDIAKRDEIRLQKENIKLERFAGQLNVTVRYSVPVDFILFQRDLDFEVRTSTYVGRL